MTVLIILASAILIDIAFNGGDALANIFKAIGTIFQPSQPKPQDTRDEKVILIQAIKEEIDELYEDLSYENSEIEDNLIKELINYKKELIDKLLSA